MSTAQPERFVGTIFANKYSIVKMLGEGGMGRVYLGEQTMGTTARKVAVKTLHQHLCQDEKIRVRFLRECSTLAELEDPNTIQVFDFGSLDDGTLYIVMEFVQGQNLADILEQTGPLRPERAVNILRQVCGSLEEAHGRGIVHRDLKPENIVLSEKGARKDWVKVLDFGIAQRSSETDANEAKLTQQGMVLGTPPYMSPEQFTGKPIDARSDLYSLGVMAYEMLVGKLPFQANTAWEWATQHMTAPPQSFEIHPESANIPPAMKQAIMRCLAKDASARFANVQEFFAAFSAVAQGRDALGTTPSSQMAPISDNGPATRARTELAVPISSMGVVSRTTELTPAQERPAQQSGKPRRLLLPVSIAGVAVAGLLGGGLFVVSGRSKPAEPSAPTSPSSLPSLAAPSAPIVRSEPFSAEPTTLVVGGYNSCALLTTGEVKCWGEGYNSCARLTTGEMKCRSDGNLPKQVVFESRASVEALTGGTGHFCALMASGRVSCWGHNFAGQLGVGKSSTRERPTPAEVVFDGGKRARALASGTYHTCAILEDDRTVCWGENKKGQLGTGDVAQRDAPGAAALFGEGHFAKSLAGGLAHTCALLDSGGVACWGSNESGQLGVGDKEDSLVPTEVDLGAGRTARAISAGASHTCVIMDTGAVKCWGGNFSGQLGVGDTEERTSPSKDLALGTGRIAVGLAAGLGNTCAVLDSGAMKCWGKPEPRDTPQLTPAEVALGGRRARAVSVNFRHQCVLLATGAVTCWGRNGGGQLGMGDPESSPFRETPEGEVPLGGAVRQMPSP